MSATLCKHGNPLVECTDEMCCLIYERTPVIPAPASEEATTQKFRPLTELLDAFRYAPKGQAFAERLAIVQFIAGIEQRLSTLQAQQAENRITTATEVAHEYERQNDELRAEVASLRASLGETQRENAQLRKERSEPRLLPDGVSECPTCGAETNHDAFLLYSIDRVTRWRAECHPDDANCITIYDDALDEMRAELTSLLATPHPSETAK